MVAFVFSLIATIVLTAIAPLYARRRPQGTPVTWGEAMVAALFVFFVMFIAWGVLPHQWLTYADNDLQWRKDKIVMGPGDVLDSVLPFTRGRPKAEVSISFGFVFPRFCQTAQRAIWMPRNTM